MYQSGRHFLQLPGPSNVPDRVVRAMGRPVMDHRSPAFGELGREVLEGLKPVFGTTGPVVIFPSSGSGGWEAALCNVLSRGDTVLVLESGRFAAGWGEMAKMLGCEVEALKGDWRRAVDPAGGVRRRGHLHTPGLLANGHRRR